MHGTTHKKSETVIHKILHFLEFAIAILTLIVLIFMVGIEIYKMFTQADLVVAAVPSHCAAIC